MESTGILNITEDDIQELCEDLYGEGGRLSHLSKLKELGNFKLSVPFHDRYAITSLKKNSNESLSISIDENLKGKVVPQLLHVPCLKEREHTHIELDKDSATKLYIWLKSYLGYSEEELKQKFDRDVNRDPLP